MPNVHMQAAATNLHQAVNDLNLYEQQIRSDTDTQKREYERRLNQIRIEQGSLQALQNQAPDDLTRQQYPQKLRQLNDEHDDIQKRVSEAQQQMDHKLQDINDQRTEMQQMADKLSRMA